MALKSDRYLEYVDISYFMNEEAEHGGCVSYNTGGSGAALDQSAALVHYDTSPSGAVPAGILLDSMVDLNLSRQHLNPYNQELQKGMKVPLLKRGWVVTNMIMGGHTPAAGGNVYLGPTGVLQAVDTGGGQPQIPGKWESKKDEDGYAKVSVNFH